MVFKEVQCEKVPAMSGLTLTRETEGRAIMMKMGSDGLFFFPSFSWVDSRERNNSKVKRSEVNSLMVITVVCVETVV